MNIISNHSVKIDDSYLCPSCMQERNAVIEYGFSNISTLIETLKNVVEGGIYNADRVTLESQCHCLGSCTFDPGDTAPMRKETAEEILNELL